MFTKSESVEDSLSLKFCLSKLKDKEQLIIDLVSQGFKQREIADKMNEKPNTVAAIISRANRKLKNVCKKIRFCIVIIYAKGKLWKIIKY